MTRGVGSTCKASRQSRRSWRPHDVVKLFLSRKMNCALFVGSALYLILIRYHFRENIQDCAALGAYSSHRAPSVSLLRMHATHFGQFGTNAQAMRCRLLETRRMTLKIGTLTSELKRRQIVKTKTQYARRVPPLRSGTGSRGLIQEKTKRKQKSTNVKKYYPEPREAE